MFKLGLVINPIAGMGGSVGLKGTDGADALMRARALGALPSAQRRAGDALAVIADAMQSAHIVAAPGAMGAEAARAAGFEPTVVDVGASDASATAAEHTRRAVREMARLGVDLLLFAGGDGTARDVCKAMAAAQQPMPSARHTRRRQDALRRVCAHAATRGRNGVAFHQRRCERYGRARGDGH